MEGEWEDPEKQRLLGVGIQEKPTRREMRVAWVGGGMDGRTTAELLEGAGLKGP